ncbi:DnaJ domain protein [Leptospira broomii serovar Hurstbridge str. 5399]|uniref:DnaJ domain protein n=1 Tax=Leptospira broomii serovar Hurstbridge str. 5399 TaxID=1049789 RepID=T0GPL2_9LEPT|nr:molecular chaperone DnaJ [Leptospira broomii]EQA47268.1 DnaJ domain protein [Leptospira broomii serovar Hurstbridge str. 5399]
MEDGDLLSRALDFYGLPKKYNEDLVRSRFRELSRKYHPDSGEFESDVLFKELVNLRDVLLESLGKYEESNSHSRKEERREDRDGFLTYKAAKQIAADALEEYFKKTEGNPVFLNPEENSELRKLRINLMEAKTVLQEFIRNYPTSIWRSDAEETLKRIGVWFRS